MGITKQIELFYLNNGISAYSGTHYRPLYILVDDVEWGSSLIHRLLVISHMHKAPFKFLCHARIQKVFSEGVRV